MRARWSMAVILGIFCTGLEAQAQPRTPPDWKLELVAQAPQIRHPTVVTCASDGRVFVAQDPMDISVPADSAQGRILCFHPDGQVTLFAQGLHAIFGMEYLDGFLYVLHNPFYSRFRDAGGQGLERVDLITQTNPKPWAHEWNDHVPANFHLAMDGYFYVAVGDKGIYGAVGTDGSKAQLRGGGILRLRPDGSELEVFCTGVRNILDVAVNQEDDLFTYDNTDEHQWMSRLSHMVEGGRYGYPWDFQGWPPYVLGCMADYGPGAATGALCYTEDGLPEQYHGGLILADFVKRQVFFVKIARRGATFVAEERHILVENGPDPDDFRPVGMCVAPDGRSLYITDWNHSDVKADVAAGRLWKLTFQGDSSPAPKPDWYQAAAMGKDFQATLDQLIGALSHPARSVRMVAQRRLAQRGPEAAQSLARLATDTQAPARGRWHALWVLDAMDGGRLADPVVEALLSDPDPTVRRQVVRQKALRRGPEAGLWLMWALSDPDASVRLAAATGLGRLGQAVALQRPLENGVVQELLSALQDPDDWVRYAAWTGVRRIGQGQPGAWAAIGRGLDSKSSAVRQGVWWSMREVFDLQVQGLLEAAVRDEGRPAQERALILGILQSIHRKDPPWQGHWWDGPEHPWVSVYHPALSARPPGTLEWEGTQAVGKVLLDMVEDPQPLLRLAALEALKRSGLTDQKPLLRQRLGLEKDPDVARAILRLLGHWADDQIRPLLEEILLEGQRLELQTAAVEAAPAVGAADLLELFLQRPKRNPEASALALEALQRMRLTANQDPAAPVPPPPGGPDAQEYLERALKEPGDPVRGRQVYQDVQRSACAVCHKVAGEGGQLGPDLSGIGLQYNRRDLAENILFPSRRVREGYELVLIRTEAGQVFSGLVREESAQRVVLQDAAGNLHRIEKYLIQQRQKSSISLMPDGLQANLTVQEFVDLLAFLETLRSQ